MKRKAKTRGALWDPERGEYVRDTGRSVTVGGGHTRRSGAPTLYGEAARATKRLLGICLHDGCHKVAEKRDHCGEHA